MVAAGTYLWSLLVVALAVLITDADGANKKPLHFCRHACRKHCPYGYLLGPGGCHLCFCLPKSLPKPCQKQSCKLYCPNGYAVDEDDCEICRCRGPTRPRPGSPFCRRYCRWYCGEPCDLDVGKCRQCQCRPKVCYLPKEVGPCRAAIPRYFYCKKVNKCLKFIYGGCKGNANNFKTLEECSKTCPSYKHPGGNSKCFLPKKVGPCKARFKRYFFCPKVDKCVSFFWGGCQPNANNFKTLAECKKQCPSRRDPDCLLPKKVGPCRASITRYFFDKKTQKCQKFSWGGCKPNKNNFKTLQDCRKKCTWNYYKGKPYDG